MSPPLSSGQPQFLQSFLNGIVFWSSDNSHISSVDLLKKKKKSHVKMEVQTEQENCMHLLKFQESASSERVVDPTESKYVLLYFKSESL